MSSGSSYTHRTFVGSYGSERVKDSRRDFNRELLAQKNDVCAELSECLAFPEDSFYDHEDLLYERSAGQLSIKDFRLEFLNVRGGEFLHE